MSGGPEVGAAPDSHSRPARRTRLRLRRLAQVSGLVAVFAIAVLAVVFVDEIQVRFAGLGYLTLFIITVVASATIILPAPAALAVGAFGAALNPWLVGVVAAVGQTLGEMSGYYVGWSGKGLARGIRGYPTTRRWMRRHGGLTLFVLAMIPNPFFDIAGMIAGATNFGVFRFVAFSLPGRTIKNIGFAFAGLAGLELFGALFG